MQIKTGRSILLNLSILLSLKNLPDPMIEKSGSFLSVLFDKWTFSALIRIISWGIVYSLVVWFSLAYLLTPNSVAVAWPPAGIYMAAILLTKPKERPWLILVLLMADFAANLYTKEPCYIKLIYGLLSSCDAIVSSWLLLRFVSSPFVLTKVRNLVLYLILSVTLCHGVFSILVSIVTHLSQGAPFISGMLYSWVAGSVGNLMLLPLIISWSDISKQDIRNIDLWKFAEVGLLIILMIASNIWLFPYSRQGLIFSFIINYLSFPFVIWAILRFEMKIVTLVMFILTLIMLFNLMIEIRGFSDNTVNKNYVLLQMYLASISFISLLITAFKDEANQANIFLREAEHKLLVKTVAIEEQERNRYSRELHDGLGPLLSTVKMYLQRLLVTQEIDKIRFMASECEKNVRLAIQTMREVSHGLSPLNLSNSGFVRATQDFISGINKLQDLTIDFSYNDLTRFGDFYEIILYRITTELINNTLKHAGATQVEINFIRNAKNNSISISYKDNGKGFDSTMALVASNGMGLLNIDQRIKILGGKFVIESKTGNGTLIYIEFPLKEINIRSK
jgi:signal transduction histidine kinase